MKVAIITTKQKKLLSDKEFKADSLFNPIEDKNNNWVISEQEINGCENSEFTWIKDLPLINYEPKENNLFK